MNYDQACSGVLNAINSLESVLSSVRSDVETQRLLELRRDIESGFYSIVLLGEFNRGKSTILNALLAQELLPTDVLPTTAAIHLLRFSKNPLLRAHFRNNEIKDLPLSAETLRNFCSIESAKALEYLEIGVPAPILADGVVFIDTPGVDDLNQHRAEVTYGFVPRSDAVIFVLDATTAVRRTEVEFLESAILASGIERLVFLANFADLLDTDEVNELVTTIRNRLASVIGDGGRPVFLVSAQQALQARLNNDERLWAESGFPAFFDFLASIRSDGPRSLSKAKQFVKRAHAIISRIAMDLDRHGELCAASDVDLQKQLTALTRLSDATQVRRDRIAEWIGDREREILAIVGKSLLTLTEQIEEEVKDVILEYRGPQFRELVEQRIPSMIKRRVKSWAESHADAISKLLAQMNREIFSALERQFNQELSRPYDPARVEIAQPSFFVSADDVSNSNIKAGLVVGGLAGVLMLAGAPMLIPIIGMAGLPYLQGTMLEHRLNQAKAKVLPETTRAVREGMDAFAGGILNALQSEIRSLRTAAESVYDREIGVEQQRIERELAGRTHEHHKLENRSRTVSNQRERLNQVRAELDDLARSFSNEVVPA
jgi:GTPase SAR1 family protein